MILVVFRWTLVLKEIHKSQANFLRLERKRGTREKKTKRNQNGHELFKQATNEYAPFPMIVLYLLPVCIHTVFHVTFFVTVLILLKILPNTVSPIQCSQFSLYLSGTTLLIDIETSDAQWEACSDVQYVSFRRAKAGSFSILFPVFFFSFFFWLLFYISACDQPISLVAAHQEVDGFRFNS